MSVRPWWLWGLGLIGVALVVLLGIIAYALLSDEDGDAAEQVAEPTAAARSTPPPPSPTAEPTTQPWQEDHFEPCEVEAAVLRGLGAACVYEFDAQACLTLEWADYVIEGWCPERSLETWPTDRCDEGLLRASSSWNSSAANNWEGRSSPPSASWPIRYAVSFQLTVLGDLSLSTYLAT